MNTTHDKLAIITGASAGLGHALAVRLAANGWRLLLTARGDAALREVADELGATALPADVSQPDGRQRLLAAAAELGEIDLLVNNASTLGATPLPTVSDYPVAELPRVFDTNVIAPVALIQGLLPQLRKRHGAVINISSDAATGPYEGWAAYGASKAALDQVSNVLTTEEPDVRVWAVDPSEMRTAMLVAAAGTQEAAQAPKPEELAVLALEHLIATRPSSGRYLATELIGRTS